MDEILTVKEAAVAYKVSQKTVRRMIYSGELPTKRVRSAIRIYRRDFEKAISVGNKNSYSPSANKGRNVSSSDYDSILHSVNSQ